jgi:hypothetical protein
MKCKVKNIEHNGAAKRRIERDEAESIGMVPGADRSSSMKLDHNKKDMGIPHLEPHRSSILFRLHNNDGDGQGKTHS